jgi:hypothetical protein
LVTADGILILLGAADSNQIWWLNANAPLLTGSIAYLAMDREVSFLKLVRL